MFVPYSSFSLDDSFLAEYKHRQPRWGALGYLVYKRTYALTKDDGSTEEFWETCKRVVEGVYQTQKGHCLQHNLPWSDEKAQRSAQEMYARMFQFKWLPPGRGLSKMGTPVLQRIGGACLNNCGFVSTKDIANPNIDNAFSSPFVWLMTMSMVGVGVGFDTRGAGEVKISLPQHSEVHTVEDSREGWGDYLRQLLESLVDSTVPFPDADYSQVRPKGAPIKGFGGTASGPEALELLTTRIMKLAEIYNGKYVDSRFIVDVANSVGECVVSGGVRRCLPKHTPIHTKRGILPIEKVKVGDLVATSKGYSEVTDTVYQGKQNITQINTRYGIFECTENHRMAVFQTFDGQYTWKKAKELTPDDQLVFVRQVLEGTIDEELPSLHYSLPTKSTKLNTDLEIPSLDTETAWFFGYLHGDGYVSVTSTKGWVDLTVNEIDVDIKNRIINFAERIQATYTVKEPKPSDKGWTITINSTLFSKYLSVFKQPNKTIRIPDFINEATSDIRGAYVAGVLDADGTACNRPFCIASSVYPEFLYDLQVMCASLGILSRIRDLSDYPSRKKHSTWQPLMRLQIGSYTDAYRLNEFICKYSYKKPKLPSKGTAAEPNVPMTKEQKDLVRSLGVKDKNYLLKCKVLSEYGFREMTGVSPTLVPVRIDEIKHNTRIDETYDLSVKDNELVAGPGLLVHNTAEIAFSNPKDEEFIQLKDFENNEEAQHWPRWASNNSVFASENTSFELPAKYTALNGEPGYLFLDNARKYGRMKDAPNDKDHRVMGANPCNEQSLENYELCCLVETFPSRCDDYNDYERTLKFAYLYAKTVTLLPTQCPETNAVMLRNRRIGCSQSGIQDAIAKRGIREHLQWCDDGYSYIQKLDQIYSDWLCIPRSIKTTSVKPSGTVSKLPAVREGIHESKGEYEFQTIRIHDNSPILKRLKEANYRIEDDIKAPNTKVVYFPMYYPKVRDRSPTMWEQLEMAALMQYYWADNQVSVTIDFDPDSEGPEIPLALEMYAHRLKGLSFLPRQHVYQQAPKIVVTKEEHDAYKAQLKPLNLENLSTHEVEDKFCDGGVCEVNLKTEEEAEAAE